MCDRHITGLRKQGGRGREDKEVVLNSKVLIHFRFFFGFFYFVGLTVLVNNYKTVFQSA